MNQYVRDKLDAMKLHLNISDEALIEACILFAYHHDDWEEEYVIPNDLKIKKVK